MTRNRVSASFMTRLGRDVRGNTVAIMAAAFIPLAGLIGGGVDMSRLYLTKTRLQQACDAGALAGRKAMASGSWTTGSDTSSNNRAVELFDANFKSGAYGTTLTNKNYTESNGEVSGVAAVTVPMTIMRIFGMDARDMTVTCTAKMEIPNTDVMFVLDVTGSMAGTRLTGLKSAVKCFYEALMRVNTAEVCGNDPTSTSYTGMSQIRMGFMPYSVNVNVGKLLHNDWLADSWDYQSREPTYSTVYSWTVGTEGAMSNWSAWSGAPTLNRASDYSWGSGSNNNVPTSGGATRTINGTPRTKNPAAANTTACTNLNTMNSSNTSYKMLDYEDGGNVQNPSVTNTSNDPPTYPATQQTLTYGQNDIHTVTGYKYTWVSNSCRLQYSATRQYTITRNTTSTKPINWLREQQMVGWTYKKVTHNIAGLKAGGWSWNNSVGLPLSYGNGRTVKLSGSNSDTILKVSANTNVAWGGCIEERKTFPNTGGNPTNDWSPIPSSAYDLDIDMIPNPSDPETQWKPILQNAVWGRYTGTNDNNRTRNDVVTTSLDPTHPDRNNTYYCTTEAKKLRTWYTPTSFVTYVNSLTATGNTFHDIGMIWGARFISPTGLFASENAATPTGGDIKRHIIFMTDGETQTGFTNYTAYGLPWWDRRQTSAGPDNTTNNNILDARLVALCEEIKKRNITLWVISYGDELGDVAKTRLKNCATPGKYKDAIDKDKLIGEFKNIASEIADLRLTN